MYRKLSRLDGVLADMAQRAARFYLMLGDLARTNDTRPEVFLAHKDALLTHMREFHSELSRYAPLLADAVAEVDATGADRLAAAGGRGRRAAVPRPRRAASRTGGAAGAVWCSGSAPAPAQRGRTAAGRHDHRDRQRHRRCCAGSPSRAGAGSAGRASCATWRSGSPTLPADADAHALFQAVFGLGAPRHVSAGHDDPEAIPARLSWWEAEPVELSRTLVRTGRAPALHGPGRIQRNEEERQRLRAEQLKATAQRRAAAAQLAGDGVYERVLDEPETQALLGLLDVALAARVPVSRTVTGMRGPVATGSAHGVRLTLRPAGGATTVHTVRGRLHLDGLGGGDRPEGGRARGGRMRVAADVGPLGARRIPAGRPAGAAPPADHGQLPGQDRRCRWSAGGPGSCAPTSPKSSATRLVSTGDTIRLRRSQDTLDATRPALTRARRPFDRRRYAYLVLALSALGRSGSQIALSELADAVAADAGRIDGLGMDTGRKADRDAFVDAVAWLEARGALRHGRRLGGRVGQRPGTGRGTVRHRPGDRRVPSTRPAGCCST